METGHTKNVANFETLIIACKGLGDFYNPSNEKISIPVLVEQHSDAKEAVKKVKVTEINFNNVEGERKTLFKPLRTTATKVVNGLKASGAPATVILDAETINRKIQGKRADNSKHETVVGEAPKNKHSVSQQSYDMQIDHLEKLIELANVEPNYNPNEEPLKIEALTYYKEKLEIINTAVKTAHIPYKNTLQTRNLILYADESGLVYTSKLIKNYVKSVFGATSPEFKQIRKIIFRSMA